MAVANLIDNEDASSSADHRRGYGRLGGHDSPVQVPCDLKRLVSFGDGTGDLRKTAFVQDLGGKREGSDFWRFWEEQDGSDMRTHFIEIIYNK
jgi:hypothetical protein